jgi:hypothetical protein
VIQIFFTGRIVRWLGVGMALALLPAMSMLGFGVLAVLPTLVAVVAFQVLRRAGNFALTRPAREVLFTVVPREDRYKAKSFIDTAVYRTGDQVGAWSYALIGGLGLGFTEAAIIAVVLSGLWLVNSLWLGRRQEVLAAEQKIAGEENGSERAARPARDSDASAGAEAKYQEERSDKDQSRSDDCGKQSIDRFHAACKTLGLSADGSFTKEELKARYHQLMKAVHPDVIGASPFAMQLNEARDLINLRMNWK